MTETKNTVFWLQHVPHETPGAIEPALVEAGLECRAVELFREVPPSMPWHEAAGLVVMGGPMNVDQTDQFPFLAAEKAWIREAIDEGLPVLGVCLGSQLIARALGAEVTANPVKEIGWYPLELSAAASEDVLFCGCPSPVTVFQWHGDTFAVPEGAVALATSPLCRNQAFRYGQRVYALQFHIEVTAAMIEAWLGEPENQREMAALEKIDPSEIRRLTPRYLPEMSAVGERVFRRFAAICSAGRRGSD